MARDRFGYGTEGNSTMGKLLSGQQVPFSEKLMRKSLGEDETNYMRITEKIGEENVKKLTERFVKEHVSKNPNLTLADLNEFMLYELHGNDSWELIPGDK
jgi:predicted Zn-dependent peptidase